MNDSAKLATYKLQENLLKWRKQFYDHYATQTLAELEPEPEKVAEDLILSGANLEIVEQRGTPCIPYSFWNKRLIGLFIRHGRDVNARDEDGDTALILSLRFALHRHPSVIKFLLAYSADPEVPNNRGETALLTLVKNEVGAWYTKDPWDKGKVLKMLQGADMTAKTDDGEWVLHFGAMSEDHQALKFLLQRFDYELLEVPTGKTVYERTPLILAAQIGNVKQCHMLVNRKCSVNTKDAIGYTALHHAVALNSSTCRDVLLKGGADPSLRTSSERDVHELACLYGNMFTDLADPYRIYEMYELNGALLLLRYADFERCREMWKLSIQACIRFGLPISLTTYELAKDFESNPELERDLYRAAVMKIDKISLGKSKIWNLLSAIRGKSAIPFDVYSEIFTFVSKRMTKSKDYGSLDEFDMDTLVHLLQFINEALQKESFSACCPHIHVIARLVIACLKKEIALMERKPEIDDHFFKYIHISLCYLLSLINRRSSVHEISSSTLKENDKLLRTIVVLDPRDRDGNSLLHVACKHTLVVLMDVLVDFGADVNSRNRVGNSPIQMVRSDQFKAKANFKAITKMLRLGAHLYSKNAYQEPVMHGMTDRQKQDFFPFVTLQFQAARVLARSQLYYRNLFYKGKKIPKPIIDFINDHIY